MKFLYIFKLFLLMVLIFGCVSVSTKNVASVNYTIGEEKHAYVGDSILNFARGTGAIDQYELLEFKLQEDITIESTSHHSFKKAFSKGTLFKSFRVPLREGIFVDLGPINIESGFWFKDKEVYQHNCLEIDKDGKLISTIMYHYLKTVTDSAYYISFISEPNIDQYLNEKLFLQVGSKQITRFKDIDNYFRFEIIYYGKNDNNIKLLYREYFTPQSINEYIIKPAFSQEFTYNLDESKYIRYKHFKIQVLSATNQELRYKVIEDDSKSWPFDEVNYNNEF